ncbi:MAG: hypothetical protein K8R18_11570 [Parvibaculum sp.]|uniref:hypothetical protein n=1 Tax=Parvibaculum sp. TaxID=2024848 RepID=UPI0025D91870|nr:hypothetical protein [Parvibaculum sp.]MCE9650249.1 hypothetical protein [Parvibaculum sp.]
MEFREALLGAWKRTWVHADKWWFAPVGVVVAAFTANFWGVRVTFAPCLSDGLPRSTIDALVCLMIAYLLLFTFWFLRFWLLRKMTPYLVAVVITGLFFSAAVGTYLWNFSRGPIIWTFGDGPHPIFGMQGGGGGLPLIWQLQFTGTNRSDEPIARIDGYVRSNLTNKQIPLYFQIKGQFVKTSETFGIPPRTDFVLIAPIAGHSPDTARKEAIRSDQFLSEYGDITLAVTFDGRGSPFVRHFKRDELARFFDEFTNSLQPLPQPAIVPKNHDAQRDGR